jgi:hypothetical protein
MDAEIASLTSRLKRQAPCSPEQLAEVQATLRVQFPEDYATFMSESDGAMGWVGKAYVALWSLEQILEAQCELSVEEVLPEACPIGSDGGGEAYALDRRTTPAGFLEIPFARLCTITFREERSSLRIVRIFLETICVLNSGMSVRLGPRCDSNSRILVPCYR